MAVLEELSLPYTLEGTNIGLTFTADTKVGAVISEIEDKQTASFPYSPAGDDTGSTFDGRTFNLLCRLSSGATVNIGPNLSTGTLFQLYGPFTTASDGAAVMMEWRNVAITGAIESDTVWVRVVCEITDDADDEILFWTWVGREKGRSASIDEIGAPFVVLKGFSTERGVESNIEGQVRCRAIMPHNSNLQLTGIPSQNIDVAYTSISSVIGGTLDHPSPVGVLPLVALCNANDQESTASDYLRVFHMQAKDEETWKKRIRFTGAGQFSSAAWVRCEIVQIPSYLMDHAGALEDDGFPPASRYGNSYGPRYPVAVACYTALTYDWWYDVCERYRTWYDGVHSPTRVLDNDERSGMSKDRSLLFAHIQNNFVDASFLPDVETTAGILSANFTGAAVKVCHFQSWTERSLGVGNPYPDLGAISGIEDTIATLQGSGWKTSLYTHHRNVDSAWFNREGGLSGGMRGITITGAPASTIDDLQLDRAFDRITARIVGKYGLRAVYFDTYTGSSILHYGRDYGRAWRNHGDKQSAEARAASLARSRADLRSRIGDPDFVITAENTEEGIFDLDWVQDGYGFIPFHMILADEEATHALRPTPPAMSDHPPQARMMSVPFWQCVHHQWAPAGRLATSFTTKHLYSNTDFYPGTDPNTTDHGLGEDEWTDFLCGQTAWSYMNGCGITFSIGWDRFDPLVDAQGNESSFDLTAAGPDILAFYQELWGWLQPAKAGEFLLYGKMLRPLECDYLAATYDTELNPASHAQYLLDYDMDGAAGWQNYSTIPTPDYRWGNAEFDVPRVIQCVWENADGVIGLVLCNWSRTAAKFLLSFDPTLYGLTTYDIDQRSLGGSPSSLDTSVTGTVTIGDVGADYNLGTLDPQTVTVVTFTDAS